MFEVHIASSLYCHSQWWKPLPPPENWRTKSIKVGVASNRSTFFFNVVASINRPEGLMTLQAVQISPSAVVIQPPGGETRCLRTLSDLFLERLTTICRRFQVTWTSLLSQISGYMPEMGTLFRVWSILFLNPHHLSEMQLVWWIASI